MTPFRPLSCRSRSIDPRSCQHFGCDGVFKRSGHGTVRGMRHLWTVVAAVVIAPAAWLLIAFGQTQSMPAFQKAVGTGTWSARNFVWPLLFLAGAGLLLGLLGTLRYSPLGAVLTGLVYVATYVGALVDGKDLYKLFKDNISLFGHQAPASAPIASGASLVLGPLLLVGVASVGRWRRWPVVAGEPELGETTEPGEAGTGEPTKDFWTPTTPGTTPLGGSPFGDENSTERVVPGQFGSPWRTPPGETTREEQSR